MNELVSTNPNPNPHQSTPSSQPHQPHQPQSLGPLGELSALVERYNVQAQSPLPLGLEEQIEKLLRKATAMSKHELQVSQVVADMKNLCDFVYVDSLSYSQMPIWFRVKPSANRAVSQLSLPMSYKPFTEYLAYPFVHQLFERRDFAGLRDSVVSACDTLKTTNMMHVLDVPKDIIRVSNKYYWDTEYAELTQAQHESGAEKLCFRELFDSSGQASISVDINAVRFEPYEINILRRFLEGHDGAFPAPDKITPQDLAPVIEDFEDEDDYEILAPLAASTLPNKVARALAPFWTWANQDVDTMNDLLKVFAVPFLKTPPKWYVYYIGDTRNGKSSCIKCQRVLMGLNNTSGFAMPALFDPHNTNHVLTTMLNAADEDYDFAPSDMQQGLANFKKAVTHDELELPNFYSQSSTTLTPKFLSIFSRNSLPNFGEGDGAQAIIKRMRAIFFKNDLSKFDSNGHDFEKETYTAEYYSALIPVILATAQFYNGRMFDLSATCKTNSGAVESVADPATHYFNELCYWFDYVGKTDFVIDQAKLFFKDNGIKYTGDTLTAINNKLAQCSQSRIKSYLGMNTKQERCRELPNKSRRKRIKMFGPDAILAPLDNQTFEQWRQRLSSKSNSMTAQQFADMPVPSVFSIMRDLEFDGVNPVAMQEALVKKEAKIAKADIDDKGNLISPTGEVLNGLL